VGAPLLEMDVALKVEAGVLAVTVLLSLENLLVAEQVLNHL
jgi:hypothetical protein